LARRRKTLRGVSHNGGGKGKWSRECLQDWKLSVEKSWEGALAIGWEKGGARNRTAYNWAESAIVGVKRLIVGLKKNEEQQRALRASYGLTRQRKIKVRSSQGMESGQRKKEGRTFAGRVGDSRRPSRFMRIQGD